MRGCADHARFTAQEEGEGHCRRRSSPRGVSARSIGWAMVRTGAKRRSRGTHARVVRAVVVEDAVDEDLHRRAWPEAASPGVVRRAESGERSRERSGAESGVAQAPRARGRGVARTCPAPGRTRPNARADLWTGVGEQTRVRLVTSSAVRETVRVGSGPRLKRRVIAGLRTPGHRLTAARVSAIV